MRAYVRTRVFTRMHACEDAYVRVCVCVSVCIWVCVLVRFFCADAGAREGAHTCLRAYVRAGAREYVRVCENAHMLCVRARVSAGRCASVGGLAYNPDSK